MPRRPKPPPVPLCGCGAPQSRRKRGTGSISYRKDGRHQAQAPRRPDGTRSISYHASHAAAEAQLDALLAPAPIPTAGSVDEPLGAYLERWFRRHEPNWEPGTRSCYRARLAHLDPLASIPVGELQFEQVQECLADLR